MNLTVYLVGGASSNEGNVFAFNPDSGIFGPICEDTWDKHDVSTIKLFFALLISDVKLACL